VGADEAAELVARVRGPRQAGQAAFQHPAVAVIGDEEEELLLEVK
jgi:hypothetical protein